jgi:DNA-directed RNA polymerase specialized sigma24 family protein
MYRRALDGRKFDEGRLMSATFDPRTRSSLLPAAGDPANQQTQAAFEERYGRLIREFCGRWRMQKADQDEIAQTVLFALFKMLPRFNEGIRAPTAPATPTC